MYVYMKLRQGHLLSSPRFRNAVRRLSVTNSICLVGVMEGKGTTDFYDNKFLRCLTVLYVRSMLSLRSFSHHKQSLNNLMKSIYICSVITFNKRLFCLEERGCYGLGTTPGRCTQGASRGSISELDFQLLALVPTPFRVLFCVIQDLTV